MDQPLTFSSISADDLAVFMRQKEKIVSAVTDHLFRSDELTAVREEEEKSRLARESVKIFVENLGATMKYDLPAAIVEYLEWLRGFLRYRGFPATFVPMMIAATRNAAHAFLEEASSDAICSALRTLRANEMARLKEASA